MPTREAMRSLAQEIVGSYEARIAGVAQIRKTTRRELREFDRAHRAMARQQRADLAQAEARRRAQAHVSHETRVADVGQIRKATRQQLREFDRAHQVMARQQRADLAQAEARRRGEAREFRGELLRTVAEGKAAVQTQLRGLAEVQAGARQGWQDLVTTMQRKRSGVTGVTKASAPPAVEEEESGAGAGTMTAGVQPATLRDRVFGYLSEHPDGCRLTELEQALGVARINLARITKALMDQGKVKKREFLYVAVQR